jgi:hypothetical protein
VAGLVRYRDGEPAAGAMVVMTDLTSAEQAAVITTDHSGAFKATLKHGDYALAITAKRGAIWIGRQALSDQPVR